MPIVSRGLAKVGKIYKGALKRTKGGPLRRATEGKVKKRTKAVKGWMEVGELLAKECSLDEQQRKPLVMCRKPPDITTSIVTTGGDSRKADNPEKRREEAERFLNDLKEVDAEIYMDGSAEERTSNGGGGHLAESRKCVQLTTSTHLLKDLIQKNLRNST